MSSKSKDKPWDDGKNPYGNGTTKKSRTRTMIVIVVILLVACAAWFARYTQAIEGRAVVPPNAVAPAAGQLPDSGR